MSHPNEHRVPLPLPPSACAIRRSYVKVTSQEYATGQPNNSSTTSINQQTIVMKPQETKIIGSPFPFFQVKFGDSSSGYGSSTSLSSAHYSIGRNPSVQSFFNHISPLGQIKGNNTVFAPPPTQAKLIKESLISVLDQVDKRVAFLREIAAELEEEKRKLLTVLNTIKCAEDLKAIADVEREEIGVTTERLLYRLNSVEVIITTPESKEQEKALEIVNGFIEKLLHIFKTDTMQAKQMCQAYLNTCTSEQQQGATDDSFQRAIIACTVDDQKRIRQRLQSLLV